MDYFDRIDKINNYINENGRVSTKNLSKIFNVSEQTIRKDLKILEENDEIKRIHGGADKSATFEDRLNYSVESKIELCKVAAKLIDDGDTIYIDGGTSYYHLIDYIPKDIRITVVTASLPIAERIKTKFDQKVYLLGGLINDITLETDFTGSIQEISSMIFHKSFFGVSGFSIDYSFTEDNFYALEFKRKVKKNTLKSIVVTGAEKEGKVAFKKAFDFSEIDVFVTNNTISEEIKKVLNKSLTLMLV